MSGHTTFIKKLFDEKETYRRENEKLQSQLEAANKIIGVLEKSNGFYADLSNWNGEDFNGWKCTHIICTEDQDEKLVGVWNPHLDERLIEIDEYDNVGGKTARQALAEVEKIRNGGEV